jgi:signal transduction histidine kinase
MSSPELVPVSRISTMGELTAFLGSELSQPLTSVRSNAEAALRFLNAGSLQAEEARGIINDTVTADGRANEIVQHMRHMLKKDRAQMTPFDLNEAIGEVLGMMRCDLIVRKVSTNIVTAPHLPLARGDRIQIQQVLLNLIFNACDSMTDKQGERTLSIETEVKGTDAGTNMIEVSIADSGPGNPPQQKEKVSEPHYRATSGAGSSLSLCRSVIAAHAGRIWASDNQRSGSVIHFTIPMCPGIAG